MAQLPIYVINLDRRPDRWQAISANLDRLGLTATRVTAVEARSLADLEEEERKKGNEPRRSINLGAAAGMLGHSKALEGLLESGRPAALVLEDDAELASDTPALLDSTDWWPAGALAVRLEHGGRRPRPLRRPCGSTPSGRVLRRLERWCGGAAAYLIDREGARIVLDAFADPAHSIDHTLFDLRVSKTARRLKTVQIVPAMARQRPDDPSDQAPWREAAQRAEPGRLKKFLDRIPTSLSYKAQLAGLRLTGRVRNVPVPYSDRL